MNVKGHKKKEEIKSETVKSKRKEKRIIKIFQSARVDSMNKK